MNKFLTRRQWLAGAAAFAATPALAAWPSGTVDVAIVGAGAAGIAAARRIAEARRSCVVLEAMGRVGGRALTADGGFRVAHDRGAHRLSSPSKNPLIDIARSERFQVYEPSSSRRLLVGAREARDGEYDDFTSALRRARRAIVAVGDIGRDVAAGSVLTELGQWEATVGFVLGPLACAKDLDDVSAIDIARAEERPDDLVVREGVGTVLAAAAERFPVERNSAVRRIDSRGRGFVTLETARGTVQARTVIVTASTNVLVSDRVRFDPALPKRTLDALARLSLGTYDRAVFELAGNPFRFAIDERVLFKTSDRRTFAVEGRVGGSDLAFADFAGAFGRELGNAGDAATVDFVREGIAAHFGADAKQKIGRVEVVRWGKEPYVQGGFSAAAPGAAPSRRILMEPVYDRIFLAGEAAHETRWGTIAGAWASGERAADAALHLLARSGGWVPVSEPQPKEKKKAR
jgi:monoamine oxidase